MGALLVPWLRPVPAEMEPFFTGPNTFGRNDDLALIVEDEGRVLLIEYHDINLIAEGSVAVHRAAASIGRGPCLPKNCARLQLHTVLGR